MRPPCPFRPGGRSRHVAVSLVAPSRLPEHPVRFNRKLKTPADCRCVPVRVLVVLRSVPAHGARRRFLVGRGTVLGRPTKKKTRFRFREPPLHHLHTDSRFGTPDRESLFPQCWRTFARFRGRVLSPRCDNLCSWIDICHPGSFVMMSTEFAGRPVAVKTPFSSAIHRSVATAISQGELGKDDCASEREVHTESAKCRFRDDCMTGYHSSQNLHNVDFVVIFSLTPEAESARMPPSESNGGERCFSDAKKNWRPWMRSGASRRRRSSRAGAAGGSASRR